MPTNYGKNEMKLNLSNLSAAFEKPIADFTKAPIKDLDLFHPIVGYVFPSGLIMVGAAAVESSKAKIEVFKPIWEQNSEMRLRREEMMVAWCNEARAEFESMLTKYAQANPRSRDLIHDFNNHYHLRSGKEAGVLDAMFRSAAERAAQQFREA